MLRQWWCCCWAGCGFAAKMKVKVTLILPALSFSTQVHAGEWIEGRVTHIRDVDTIEVNNLPIRLEGVDGPELTERGGKNAKRWMQKLAHREPVRCWLTGAKNPGPLDRCLLPQRPRHWSLSSCCGTGTRLPSIFGRQIRRVRDRTKPCSASA